MTRPRFNPRLHPLLALGIGLALASLLLPGRASEAERHTDEEILARLVAPEADLEHGPLFWLRQQQAGSQLYRRAVAACAEGLYTLRPGCRLLATLESFAPGSPLAAPTDTWFTAPAPPPSPTPEGEP